MCVPFTGVGTTIGICGGVAPGDGEITGAGVGYLLQSGTRQHPSFGSAFSEQADGIFV